MCYVLLSHALLCVCMFWEVVCVSFVIEPFSSDKPNTSSWWSTRIAGGGKPKVARG